VGDEPTWRRVLEDAAALLGDRSEARRLVETASGREGAELTAFLDSVPTQLALAHCDSMLVRRRAGEPLQYVLGGWGFRTLDVHVDPRVLIPRPETEIVVERALQLIDALGARVVVDLGTGSGVIALSIAVERPEVSVWATDVSTDALDVALANLAGAGSAATRVRLEAGDWLDALPDELLGAVDLIVSNPPYVAEHEVLPVEVGAWEPRVALVAGPTGLEAIELLLHDAPSWLRVGGGIVLEIGETQRDAVLDLASGYANAAVFDDLAGRPRVLVATR
jgi:release factor glutamine methyltransferase